MSHNGNGLQDVPGRYGALLELVLWTSSTDNASLIAEVLAPHDTETTNSSKRQFRLVNLVNQVQYERCVSFQDQLPDTEPRRGTGDVHRETETGRFAEALERIQSGTDDVCRLPIGEARRLIQGHLSFRFCVHGTARLGEKKLLPQGCLAAVYRRRCECAACATMSTIGERSSIFSTLFPKKNRKTRKYFHSLDI